MRMTFEVIIQFFVFLTTSSAGRKKNSLFVEGEKFLFERGETIDPFVQLSEVELSHLCCVDFHHHRWNE